MSDKEGDFDALEQKSQIQQVDDIQKFLQQIPPDWEAARKHGRANLVVDSSKTKIDPSKPETFCKCCQLPYPEDEDYFPFFVPVTELGVLGPGYPLFFLFMKYIIFYLMFITIIYFCPIAF